MANTVNDVMNIIANPDYGIKSIAGTSHEILAVLQGTHNSKNNLHAIVDDVKTLLQKLVDTSTQKKPIEIGNKSPKINPKNIQDILDETKNITKSIDNLTKAILKQSVTGSTPTIAKLTDKASQKVADAMVKDIEKQNKGGGMSALVDAFNRLKDISLKDIVLGKLKLKKISNLFKNAKENLNIKEKDLNNIISLINAAPQMIKSLSKIGWRINLIVKNNIIQKLSDILIGKTSLISISKLLSKNAKIFSEANKTTKDIKELVISLNEIMKELVFATLWAKLANKNIASIENTFNTLIPVAKKLTKNKKDIDDSIKSAKNIIILTGNLLISSIFLTAAAIVSIPALLGAKALAKIIDIIIPATKKLSKNKKYIGDAVLSAISLVAFTGVMTIASLALTAIAIMGVPALIGSAVLLGVVAINIVTFKMISNAKKNIIMGSIIMGIMSASLLLYGIALNKITKATENVTWKQVGIIASTLVILALATAVLGEPTTAVFISLGSLTMSLLSMGLLVFGTALNKISKATENLKMTHVLLVGGSIMALALPVAGIGVLSGPIALGSIALTALSLALIPFLKTLTNVSKATENLDMKQLDVVKKSMWKLGLSIAEMAILTIPITLGSVAIGAMGTSLFVFTKTLKSIKDIGGIPQKEVETTLDIMRLVGDFYKNNPLNFKSLRTSILYQMMMRPFGKVVKHLNKLKELGSVPIKLVHQTLNAMKTIGDYYTENPISLKTIFQAKRYKRMMRPFGKTLSYFAKLKELGSIPLKLVYQTLNAMKTIADYYVENPIERKTYRQARRYKKMLKPFGKTLSYFAELKELGSIPIKLVHQTLNAMYIIANHYIVNPIEKDAIKTAERYKDIIEPFLETIEYLSKFKNIETAPIEPIKNSTVVMSIISDFYTKQKIESKANDTATKINGLLLNFKMAVKLMKRLNDAQSVPTGVMKNIIAAIGDITNFYNNITFGKFIKLKSKYTEMVVDKFSNLTKILQDKFSNTPVIDTNAVNSIVIACHSIIDFYRFGTFFTSEKMIDKMNRSIEKFSTNVKYIKDNLKDFSVNDYIGVVFATKSMKEIVKFLKKNTLNTLQRIKARKNISILKSLTSTMSNLSNINTSNLSSVGDILTNTLNGVNTVDLGQVQAVTNMFNAFNGINKSEGIINKFTESVKEFTTTCKNLMDAMNYNTNAINNFDVSAPNESTDLSIFDRIKNNIANIGTNNNTSETNGIYISNVEEIARTIAEKINGTLSVDIPDTQVQLLINGSGGNEWTISRY